MDDLLVQRAALRGLDYAAEEARDRDGMSVNRSIIAKVQVRRCDPGKKSASATARCVHYVISAGILGNILEKRVRADRAGE